MSILSDADVRRLLQAGDLVITPFNEERLTPIGYNLSVGDFYFSKRTMRRVDLAPGQHFAVAPAEVVALRSLERLELPRDRSVSGFVLSKVKMINAGFAQVASTLDSDHRGYMLISVQNISRTPATLVHGQPFCTVVLVANATPSSKQSNNPYDDAEIVETLLSAWSRSRETTGSQLWRTIRPVAPILFVVMAAAAAYALLGNTVAFGGVMGAIATIAVLMERSLGK